MLTKKEEFVLFWKGPFSQWYPSLFVVQGITYHCAEQYMMAQKALLFNDQETYTKIMNEKSPRLIKDYGRQVKSFDEVIWEKHRFTIVLTASIAKFKQNKDLKEILLSTGLATLVEASPYDDIWGIKLSEEDPRALDRSQWDGLNLLGQALTLAREYIKCNEMYGDV